jgi:hypothetical protein
MFPYLIQGSNIVVVIDNQPHTISSAHISYEKVKQAIKDQDWEAVRKLAEPAKAIQNYADGKVEIRDGQFFWEGEVMHGVLANKIVTMFKEGFPIEPLVAFVKNLQSNPSSRAVNELYSFLEAGNMPITSDGHFLAYKKVRDDYKDVYSGTIYNRVGDVVEMARNKVNDNSAETCSHGLHFCSMGYLSHFGGERIVILKINPRDVVSIPADYNDTKGRCCRYEVIGEVTTKDNGYKSAFSKSVQDNAVGNIAVTPVKTGTSDFIRGYTAGYTHDSYNPRTVSDNYYEGYVKGEVDRKLNRPQRYSFTAQSNAYSNATFGSSTWPHATR